MEAPVGRNIVNVLLSPRALVNLEGIFAIILLVSIWMRSGKSAPPAEESRLFGRYALAALLLATILAFWPVLHHYFLSDDFGLLTTARVPLTGRLLYEFQRPVFFRPLIFLAFRFEWLWAGDEPWRWHITAILLHVLISGMIYAFGARLYGRREIGFWAAAIFAWHGLHPEVVAWNTGLFDLLPTAFGLGALLLLLLDIDRPRTLVAAGAVVCEIGALLAKETAYCLPLLAILLVAWRAPRAWRRVIPLCVTAMVMFVVRWWVLGGFGGYPVHATALHTAEAMGVRIWALLWFPVNWKVTEGWVIRLAIAAAMGAAVLLAWTRASRRDLAFPLGFVVLGSLPALSQLLIGADLQGSRCLYLPSAGFALLIGVMLQGLAPARIRIAAGTTMLLFQLAALERNLQVWGEVANLAKRTCESGAAQLKDDEAEVTIAGVPHFIDGVQFYNLGLPECIAMHGKRAHIRMVAAGTPGATLVWDGARLALVRTP